jgi:enediyne biosynthesis protein E4
MPCRKSLLLTLASVLFVGTLVGSLNAQTIAFTQVPFPKNDVGLSSLTARKKAQLESVSQFKVFYQFRFTDQLPQSGIAFRNHVVRYASSQYMPIHYDHGTGIAAADVDGDGLYDIYFASQLGGNELWHNLGNGKFENITDQAGVGLKGRVNVSSAFGDVDNTGHQDLYVTTVNEGNVLFQNDGHGHFKDITHEAGLDLVAHSSGAFFFDYDNDGLVDLLVCNVGVYTTDEKDSDGAYIGMREAFSGHLHPERFEHPVLYKNLGHYRFKDVTQEVGLNPQGWCGDASFTDIKGDGWPGIYFLNMQGADHYFENQGGKKFVEKTQDYFPRTPWGSMGIKFFDYDNDGRMDLLITDMHSDMMQEQTPDHEKEKIDSPPPDDQLGGPAAKFIFGNSLYHNLGQGKFEEISDKMGVEQLWPWGLSVRDLNADGYEDVFITAGMNFPFRYGINSLLLNNRGEKFLDSEFLLGVEPRQTPYTSWFTMDCTNHGVLAPLGQAVCGDSTTKLTLAAPKASRSSVIFDLDNDGDLDVVTNDFNSEPMVLISDLTQQKKIHWLKIVLVGTNSNRNGLGATVRVYSDGRSYTRFNDGKSGYLSQSVLPLYFGLGENSKIDRIEVSWPSRRKQVILKGLHENQTLKITEPSE